jgi:ankyrin repeat protein
MTDNTVSSEVLFEICTAGDFEKIQQLLEDPAYVAKTVAIEEWVDPRGNEVTRPRLNLDLMLQKAARSGSAELVKYLLSFANAHGIPYEDLIYRDSICAAIDSNNGLAVFKELLAVKLDIVDQNMGHVGTPLTQSIGGGRNAPRYSGERETLLQFLLENGADPNRITGQPFTYLTKAVQHASLKSIELLIKHGARVEQSGAMHTAAEDGRLDVMNLLLEHGANVNEQLTENLSYSASYRARKKKEKGIISDVTDALVYRARKKPEGVVISNVRNLGWSRETPLHYSVLDCQVEATKWLIQHGADAEIEDSKGWSAKAMAVEIGDEGVLEALGLKAAERTG